MNDTLAVVPVAPDRLPRTGDNTCGPTFYAEDYTWDLDPGFGLHIASTASPRVMTYEDGALRRIITWPHRSASLPHAEQELLRRAMENRWRRIGVASGQIARLSASMCFPEVLPPVAAVRTGPEGTLWVARPPTPSTLLDENSILPRDWGGIAAPEWAVFDRDGRLLGDVALPARFRPYVFRDDWIYGAWEDELGVPYVVRLRVIMPGAE